MDERTLRRDTEKVVRKVLRLVEKHEHIGKQEFEAINRKVMEYVHKHTGIGMEQIESKVSKVIQDMPNEYGQMDESSRSWEALIAYLYTKYLKELEVM